MHTNDYSLLETPQPPLNKYKSVQLLAPVLLLVSFRVYKYTIKHHVYYSWSHIDLNLFK